MSWLATEIRAAFEFGVADPRSVTGFLTHFLLLAIPGILLGHLLDEMVMWAQQRYRLSATLCLTAQTVAWALFFLVLYRYLPRYGAEFQSSYAGLAFVTLFFTVQDNYVANLNKVLQFADHVVA